MEEREEFSEAVKLAALEVAFAAMSERDHRTAFFADPEGELSDEFKGSVLAMWTKLDGAIKDFEEKLFCG